MALAEEVPKVLHAGDGSRGPFAIAVSGVPITYASHTHIRVYSLSDTGVPTVLVEGVDYDLSAASVLPPVGTSYPQTVSAASVTLKASYPVLAVGQHLLIERVSPATQEQVLTSGGGFSSASNERAYDAIVRQIQELWARARRTFQTNHLDPQGSLTLDKPAAQRAGKMLGFNSSGGLEVVDRPAYGVDSVTA